MQRTGLSAAPSGPELALAVSDPRGLEDAHAPIEGRAPSRVHFGNEFCERLLVTQAQLERALDTTHARSLELSLVLPYLTERTFDRAAELVRSFAQRRPGGEVICNDWGVLRLVAAVGDLRPVLGRALNRALVDPRVPEHLASDLPDSALAALRGGALDAAPWIRFLERYRVDRIEADLSPLDHGRPENSAPLPLSLHLPYTFVASGRVCLFAGLGRTGASPGLRFSPGRCRYECAQYELELAAPPTLAGRLPLIQRGNTVFVRHPGPLSAHLEGLTGTVDRVVWSREVPMGGGPAC